MGCTSAEGSRRHSLSRQGAVRPRHGCRRAGARGGQRACAAAVVNLTAFETVFPEKGPFSVEGGNLHSFGHAGCEIDRGLGQHVRREDQLLDRRLNA